MKKVEAIIVPYKLDVVRDALLLAGIERMTVAEVNALNPRRHRGWYRGSEYIDWYEPQTKIELLVDDERVTDIVEAIKASGSTDERAAQIVVSAVNEMSGVQSPDRSTAVARSRPALRELRRGIVGRAD